MQLTKFATTCEFDCECEIRNTAALGARLEDALMLEHGFIELAAFLNIHGAGFFAKDVFACTGRINRCGGVPTVAGGDKHGIDIIPTQHVMHVDVGVALLDSMFPHGQSLHDFPFFLIRIGNGQKLKVRLLEKGTQHLPASAAKADAPHGNTIRRSHRPVETEHRAWDNHWSSQSTSADGCCLF